MIHDTMLIVGVGCIAAAAFMIYTPLGLAVLGAALVSLAFTKPPKETKNAS